MQLYTGVLFLVLQLSLSSAKHFYDVIGEPSVTYELVCPENEDLRDTMPCCEPTCDNDCTSAKCSKSYVRQPTCVCKQGYVRHKGKCILLRHCPAKPPSPLTCAENEELLPSPPSCEPTCTEDCAGRPVHSRYIDQPTCVCKKGYRRHKGKCIRVDQCPSCGPYATLKSNAPCCEPTCENDCSNAQCTDGYQSDEPVCVCQDGYVKHNSTCIKRELCPQTAYPSPVQYCRCGVKRKPKGRVPVPLKYVEVNTQAPCNCYKQQVYDARPADYYPSATYSPNSYPAKNYALPEPTTCAPPKYPPQQQYTPPAYQPQTYAPPSNYAAPKYVPGPYVPAPTNAPPKYVPGPYVPPPTYAPQKYVPGPYVPAPTYAPPKYVPGPYTPPPPCAPLAYTPPPPCDPPAYTPPSTCAPPVYTPPAYTTPPPCAPLAYTPPPPCDPPVYTPPPTCAPPVYTPPPTCAPPVYTPPPPTCAPPTAPPKQYYQQPVYDVPAQYVPPPPPPAYAYNPPPVVESSTCESVTMQPPYGYPPVNLKPYYQQPPSSYQDQPYYAIPALKQCSCTINAGQVTSSPPCGCGKPPQMYNRPPISYNVATPSTTTAAPTTTVCPPCCGCNQCIQQYGPPSYQQDQPYLQQPYTTAEPLPIDVSYIHLPGTCNDATLPSGPSATGAAGGTGGIVPLSALSVAI
uniref:EGF-like domain-containing protein n=1 Tax=Anopheles minimus TaxID=112268 RepID=A0A182WPL3_9DIPT